MEMKTASVISTGLHVAVLVFATLSFTSKSFDVTPAESLPVDFISDKQFSEITKGIKDAPKPEEKPKPLVEKKADVQKSVEETKPKVTEKKELEQAAEKAPPPEPQPKPKEAKAEKPPEPKPEPKPDPVAKKIEQAEHQEAKATPTPLPPKRPPMKKPPEPKFDADKIAALLDKREPVRTAATGEEVNPNAGLGRVNGTAVRLSQSELDALRRRISQCWTPPVGADAAQDLTVVFRVLFNEDGTVKQGPSVVEGGASAFGPVFAESARRAILQCQPYTMLRRETFNLWKDMEIGFKPSDMFR